MFCFYICCLFFLYDISNLSVFELIHLWIHYASCSCTSLDILLRSLKKWIVREASLKMTQPERLVKYNTGYQLICRYLVFWTHCLSNQSTLKGTARKAFAAELTSDMHVASDSERVTWCKNAKRNHEGREDHGGTVCCSTLFLDKIWLLNDEPGHIYYIFVNQTSGICLLQEIQEDALLFWWYADVWSEGFDSAEMNQVKSRTHEILVFDWRFP